MISPFKNTFDNAKLLSKYANIILFLSTFLIVLSFIVSSFSENNSKLITIIDSINCLLIIAYAVFEYLINNTFFEASIHRRCDFIDNSFNTSYSEENSSQYYSNDDLTSGIYKMAVNGFENVFFTYNISKLMLNGIWIKNIIIALIFISLGILGYNNTLILFIQLSLPVILVSQSIRHTAFVNRINRVYENYRRLFQDLRSYDSSDQKIPEMILNVIEYETTLSWGEVLLDSKLYNKMNSELSKKWETIKNKYNIK